ncbi:MAG: immunoglobulin domain-containing protein [Acidobacteriota bacterium]|nr:immunoglobulin domain-containing protein [Acidobacteriota bacterium]
MSATTATVSITGSVGAHASTDSVNNLTINFLGAAFSGGSAAGVGNASYSQLKINFNDPYQLIYYDAVDTTCDTYTTWQPFYLEGSNYAYPFGLWYYGYNYDGDPANYTFKLETYTQPALCTGTTPPGNLIPLSANGPIGSTSQYWCLGGTYGGQHTITGPSYISWNGRTAYVGFQFLYHGYTVYGWMRLQVNSSGTSVTLLDYAWDQDPRNTILAGQKTSSGTAPTITTQPVSKTVNVGQTATFSVVATGTTPLSYQWYKNGVAMSGATSSSYTTPATTSSDNDAIFYVRVSNSYGSVSSNSVTLTVVSGTAPTITTQPVSKTVNVGQTATFSVVATGTTPLSYQWYKNGVAMSGATSSSYTTPATTSSDNGTTFYVVISNSAGSVTSNTVTLTVTSSTAFITVVSPNGGEQWQRGTTQTIRWSSSGVTNVKIELLKAGVLNKTIVSSTAASTGSYNWAISSTQGVRSDYTVRVTSTSSSSIKDVSDAYFSIISTSVTAPTITTQPVSKTVNAGQTATFSVVATGTTPLSYQWYKNSVAISGATAASYTTPATTSADNGAKFYVVVSNSAGSITSNTVTLTVTSTPSTLAVISPNGGEQWARGYTYTIRWTAPSTTSYIDIALYRGSTFVQWITWYLPASTGSYSWKIPTSLAADSTYKIMIVDYYTRTLTDYSDGPFQLY